MTKIKNLNRVIPFKIAIAQMNPTVGDYAANSQKIISWIQGAERAGAELIVFPECALCGYPVWDLANKKSFVDQGLKELKRIAAATKNTKIAVVLGFIDRATRNAQRATRAAYNAAAWIEKGKVRTVYHKQLLPTYDVFLEEIFFKRGDKPGLVSWKGKKIGLTICEDIWDEGYSHKPLMELKKKGADFVINLSASPYYRGVEKTRAKLIASHARKYKFPVLYVNQTGGQDELLFDGQSFLMDARGRVIFQAPAFQEGFLLIDSKPFQPRRLKFQPAGLSGWDMMYQALIMGVRDYFRKNGFQKAVIGLSGGIDSALVAAIAVDALGPEAVKGVTMPGPYSSEGSWKDSEKLAKNLGIEFEVRPIKTMYDTFLKGTRPSGLVPRQTKDKFRATSPESLVPSLAMENLQARLRGLELMYLSNDEGRLLLTTGNKSELAMGYCTLYGDMAGGLAVIGDLYKSDVYALTTYRNSIHPVIPDAIVTKAPSAELAPGQKDEDSLPPYDVLDEVLRLYIEKNLSISEIVKALKRHREPCSLGRGDLSLKNEIACNDNIIRSLVSDTIRKVDHNEYKRRQAPPILRVTEKAWFGRRMPITNKFQG